MSNFDDPIELQNLMRELAASEQCPVSGVMEERLRTAFRVRQRKRRLMSTAISIVACLSLAFGWEWRVSNRQAGPVELNYNGFMALPYAESDVPIEQVMVVRVNLQAADLNALGLPSDLLSGRTRMSADLLIGQDGIARAVRLAR